MMYCRFLWRVDCNGSAWWAGGSSLTVPPDKRNTIYLLAPFVLYV